MARLLIFLVRIIALLPIGVLFLFSDFLYFMLFGLFSYRKQVIRENLVKSFPEKSTAEIRAIEKGFYHFFTDMIVETIKNFRIPTAKTGKYIQIKNPELLSEFFQKEKNVLVVMGHHGNWEYILSMLNPLIDHQLNVLYKPFKSEVFHEILAYERRKHGIEIIPMKSALRTMMRYDKPTVTVFIADQAPSNVDTLWTNFLNQETPIFEGPERIGARLKSPVIFLSVKRTGRGHYELEFKLISEDASKEDTNQISLEHTKMLEADINRQPHTWLWSHKRWKRERPNYIELIN